MNGTSGNKTLLIATGIVIVFLAGFFIWISYHTAQKENAPVENTKSIVPVLASDLYPLYAGASWGAPYAETLELSTTTVSGVGIKSVSVNGTMDPGSVFSPFEKYYKNKLESAGWKNDTYLEAGGPMGEQTGYRKESKLIIVRDSTVFHVVTDTAPSECPCDVTLALFSAD